MGLLWKQEYRGSNPWFPTNYMHITLRELTAFIAGMWTWAGLYMLLEWINERQ